jgi:8-oxo-dGTP diphosphatase
MSNFRKTDKKTSRKQIDQLLQVAHRTKEGITQKLKTIQIRRRLRGTAIVDTPEGILLVSKNGNRFSLPGGGANKQETGEAATVRELEEETGLKATATFYLFHHTGRIRKRSSRLTRNYHEVFLVETVGKARPKQEIKVIQFYRAGDRVSLSAAAESIIGKYLSLKQSGAIAELQLQSSSAQSSSAENSSAQSFIDPSGSNPELR